MTWRARLTGGAAVGLAAAVAAAAVVSRGASPGQAPAPSGAVAAPDGKHLGEQRRQDLHLRVELAQPQRAEPLAVGLSGEWVTTVVAEREGEVEVACQVVGAQLSGSGVAGAAPLDLEALARRLGRLFWVTYRRDGSPLRLHFPRGIAPGDRNLLEMLVTEAQLVRPAGDLPQWTAVERDGAGTYLALYAWERREPDGSGQLAKRKLKYLQPGETAEAASGLKVEVTSSARRYRLDPRGEPIAMEGGDELRITMPMGSPGPAPAPAGHLDVRSALELGAARAGQAPELVGSLERARPELDDAPIGTQPGRVDEAVARRDARLLEGRATADLLAAAGAAGAVDGLLPARLAALFRRRPEAIPAGLSLVRARGGRPLVTEALAVAATGPAIEGLGRLARDGALARSGRIDALNALVRLRRPSAEAVGIPTDLLDDPDPEVRRAARMVLGALAYALRSQDPAAQAVVERALVARIAGATPAERADLLEGLGNSAGPETLPTAERVLQEAGAPSAVRVAAARALRRLEDPGAERRLAALIGEDGDPRVRLAAVTTAGRRWPERTTLAPPRAPGDPMVASLLRAATRDPAEAVRRAAVASLRGHESASPEVRTALAEVADHDASPDLRRLAREALGADAPAR